jgi:hypothetical protein
MPIRFNPSLIPLQRRISMERMFSGQSPHRTIKGVALHVGVNPRLAGMFLKHLKKQGAIPRQSAFWKK